MAICKVLWCFCLSTFVVSRLFSIKVVESFWSMMLFFPAIISLNVIRQAFYVKFRPSLAALSSFCYFCIFQGGIIILYFVGKISPSRVFWIMGISSILTITVFLKVLAPSWNTDVHKQLSDAIWQKVMKKL